MNRHCWHYVSQRNGNTEHTGVYGGGASRERETIGRNIGETSTTSHDEKYANTSVTELSPLRKGVLRGADVGICQNDSSANENRA